MRKSKYNKKWIVKRLPFVPIILIVLTLLPFLPLGSSEVTTVATTLYATLQNILLALLALAVTAYVFLSTSLNDNREAFEKETIQIMLRNKTHHLMLFTGLAIFCLSLCFVLDNMHSSFLDAYAKPVVAVVTSINCILLLIYTYQIIPYEKELQKCAQRERQQLYMGSEKPIADQKLDSRLFKQIGDLELLGQKLIQNHEDAYHIADYIAILRIITSHEFADSYQTLMRFRNFLRVEQPESLPTKQMENVQASIQFLQDELRSKYLKGERLTSLSLTAPFLHESQARYLLEGTVFMDSALEDINFSNAKLTGSEFVGARLVRINFSEADCKEAVFRDTVWKDNLISSGSHFAGAIFDNVIFNRQKFIGNQKILDCSNTSFVHANLLACRFHRVNLQFSNMCDSLLSQALLDTVCLSYADLSNAILTRAQLTYSQKEAIYCFPPKSFWLKGQYTTDGTPELGYDYEWAGRYLCPMFFANLKGAVFAQASLSNLNLIGSRMADSNFSDAKLEYCIFDRCYGQRATFQEAQISHCRFHYAMLNESDLSYTKIDYCDFFNANLMQCLMVQTTIRLGMNNQRANFHRANFTGAQLRDCTFIQCDFTGALFTDANLTNVKFQNCIFQDTDFNSTYIDQVTCKGCVGMEILQEMILRNERNQEIACFNGRSKIACET